MVSPIHFKGEDEINFEACPRITREAHRKNRQKTDICIGDLILHRIGAGLGQVRLVTADMPEFSILHSLAQIRTNSDKLKAAFLYCVMQSGAIKMQIALGIQSIGVPDLGLDKIGNILVFVPQRLDEQEQIFQTLSLVAEDIKRESHALNKIRHLKSGLQDDLLTGRVRVPETIMEGATMA
jgi:type I restriction enzyme S subunit